METENLKEVNSKAEQMPLAPSEKLTVNQSNNALTPQAGCSTCNGGDGATDSAITKPSFIYALGQIEARFPRLSVEKEFAQAIGRTETKGQTDRQAFHQVLAKR
jgi:hypothetical protein